MTTAVRTAPHRRPPATPQTGTTMTAPADTAAPTSRRLTFPGAKQNLLRSVRAEWIKMRTLRSTWITSVIALLLTTLMGAGLTIYSANSGDPNAGRTIGAGMQLGAIVVAVLGALQVTGEYTSGQIRSSLAATPKRSRLIVAKALCVSPFAFALGSASALASWVVAYVVKGDKILSITDPDIFSLVWGAGLAFAGISLLALALGFLMRSTAGAITTVMTLLFVIDIPLALLSTKWESFNRLRVIEPLHLSDAVTDPFSLTITWGSAAEGSINSLLEHWQAVCAFAAWAIIPMVIAWFVFTRRDA